MTSTKAENFDGEDQELIEKLDAARLSGRMLAVVVYLDTDEQGKPRLQSFVQTRDFPAADHRQVVRWLSEELTKFAKQD